MLTAELIGYPVNHQNLLVRAACPEQTAPVNQCEVMEISDDLPGIWVYAPMIARLRVVDSEWRILERYLRTGELSDTYSGCLSHEAPLEQHVHIRPTVTNTPPPRAFRPESTTL